MGSFESASRLGSQLVAGELASFLRLTFRPAKREPDPSSKNVEKYIYLMVVEHLRL